MEIPLFVKESALLHLNPKAAGNEAALLATFDANRDRINAVAAKLHGFDRQSFHILEASDFE